MSTQNQPSQGALARPETPSPVLAHGETNLSSAPASDAAGENAVHDTSVATMRRGGGPSHTPGPWRVKNKKPWCVVAANGRGFVECKFTSPPAEDIEFARAESEANARLIAAAPELLEALRAANLADWASRNLDGMDPLHPGRLAAKREAERTASLAAILRRSAVAKAEGREG